METDIQSVRMPKKGSGTGAPHVTICVPVYNGATFVNDTLRSAQAQSFENLTVIVSDDASTDSSVDLCSRFVGDTRFELHVQPKRLGFVGNCNWLLEQASGEFVCLLPHDDVIEPDYIARLLEPLRRSECAMAFCDMVAVDDSGGETTVERPTLEGKRVDRLRRFLQFHLDGTTFRGLVRKSVVDRVGGLRFNQMDGFAADVGWVGRILCLGDVIRVPRALYRKRIHAGSTSQRWGRWPPERLFAAWVLHCSELVEDAIKLGLSDEELIALAPAWAERMNRLVPYASPLTPHVARTPRNLIRFLLGQAPKPSDRRP